MIFRRSTEWANAINEYTDFLRAGSAPASTIRLRRHQLRFFAERNLHRSPWRLRQVDLIGHLANQHWAPETIKSNRAALRSFYRWAREAGHIRRDPAAALPPVRIPPARARPVPGDTYAAALAAADDRLRLMLLLGFLAGLRAGEIAQLRLTDIDLAAGELIVSGKGGRHRRVPIHERLREQLAAELERRRRGSIGSGHRYTAGVDRWLFPGQSGRHITAGAVSRVLSRALGESTGHQLRHGFASAAYAGTRDLRAVQGLLGHAQLSTTERYTAMPDGAMAAAVAAILTGHASTL